MPNILTQGRDTAHFMVSEAPGYRSRDEIEITGPALAGQILSNQETLDGRTLSSCILWENIAEGVTAKRTVIARDAEVVGAALLLNATGAAPTQAAVATAHAALAAVGIIVREPSVPSNATA